MWITILHSDDGSNGLVDYLWILHTAPPTAELIEFSVIVQKGEPNITDYQKKICS